MGFTVQPLALIRFTCQRLGSLATPLLFREWQVYPLAKLRTPKEGSRVGLLFKAHLRCLAMLDCRAILPWVRTCQGLVEVHVGPDVDNLLEKVLAALINLPRLQVVSFACIRFSNSRSSYKRLIKLACGIRCLNIKTMSASHDWVTPAVGHATSSLQVLHIPALVKQLLDLYRHMFPSLSHLSYTLREVNLHSDVLATLLMPHLRVIEITARHESGEALAWLDSCPALRCLVLKVKRPLCLSSLLGNVVLKHLRYLTVDLAYIFADTPRLSVVENVNTIGLALADLAFAPELQELDVRTCIMSGERIAPAMKKLEEAAARVRGVCKARSIRLSLSML